MTRLVLDAGKVTIGYDWVHGHPDRSGALIEPFPTPPDADDVLLVGGPDELRALAGSIAALADDLEEEVGLPGS